MIVIATSTTAVPKSAMATKNAIAQIESAIGNSVCLSLIASVRWVTKYARKSASAGFANSEG
jgi:hypothetical protein